MNFETGSLKRMEILGVGINVINLEAATQQILAWAKEQGGRIVHVREVASLMSSRETSKLLQLNREADLVVPDGMPLVLSGMIRGYGGQIGRVAGADLLDQVCRASLATGATHYFYGGKQGIALKLVENLTRKYPAIKVAGCFSPPMRIVDDNFQLTLEVKSELDEIRNSDAEIIWVGISSPKQEYWMSLAASYVGRGVYIGIGAAFDYGSGTVARAPKWMQRCGLEWLHRLISEPQRLWKRYIILAPKFVVLAICENIMLIFRRKDVPNFYKNGQGE